MDNDMGKQILETILEAGHGTSLLDALYGAAKELGTPEVYVEACAWLGYEPPEVELGSSNS